MTVNVHNKWVNTGIDIPAGSTVEIVASGTACNGGCGSKPVNWYTPDGFSEQAEQDSNFLLEGANKFSLIAKIGVNTPFYVGSLYQSNSLPEGRLYFAMNDDHFDDNEGSWNVVITVITNK